MGIMERLDTAVADASDAFSGRDWYAVVALPGRQAQARDELTRQAYGVFMPMCLRERKNGRTVEVVERPLFERYVFVGVLPGQGFTQIRSTRGVAYVVHDRGYRPCGVHVGALRRIKRRIDADGGVLNLVPGRGNPRVLSWAPGTNLRITDGPMQGLLALFDGVAGCGGAARVLVEVFGRPTLVTAAVASLEEVA